MMDTLNTFIAHNLFAFLLIFTRVGTAVMIMPGIGDSFVSSNIRLLFALAISFVMTPVLFHYMPAAPDNAPQMVMLLMVELLIGAFIGTIMRILITALDTAGVVIALQSGFANAQVFNPVAGGQGSVVSALLSMLGVTLLFVTNMHHHLISSIFESYRLFPATGDIPDTGSMLQTMSHTVSFAYNTGVQFSLPFIIVGITMYLGFGVLGRLMPQLQIFFLALPMQIWISLAIIALTISTGMLYWLNAYEAQITQIFM